MLQVQCVWEMKYDDYTRHRSEGTTFLVFSLLGDCAFVMHCDALCNLPFSFLPPLWLSEIYMDQAEGFGIYMVLVLTECWGEIFESKLSCLCQDFGDSKSHWGTFSVVTGAYSLSQGFYVSQEDT